MRMAMLKIALCLLLPTVLWTQAGSAFGAGSETAGFGTSAPAAPGDVLARVDGIPITRAEVDHAIRLFLAQTRASHDLAPETRREAEDAALEQLITTRLLYRNGTKLEIRDLDKQVNDRIDQEKAKFPTPEAYEAALQANGFTEQDARDLVRTYIVVSNVVNREIVSKIIVSEADIRNYYDQNLNTFKKPEGVRLRHILIGVAPLATLEEKKKAREKAETVRGRLMAGEDFASVAKSESSCPSKEQGGDLGFFEKGGMIPEFEKAAEFLKPGEISQVVETWDGYHVLTLVEKDGATVVAFDDAKANIESYLKQTKTQHAIKEYVNDLKKKATIEIFSAK